MLVTTNKVKNLNPCNDRFNNFTKKYPNYSGTLREFLKLDKITYDDKVWVFTRLLDKDTLVKWAIKCAESVKYIYDNKMKDGKLDLVFNTLNSIENFNNMSESEIEAARAAARVAALWSEESAVWSAEWSAKSAVWSVEWSATWSAESAVSSAKNKKQQEQLNLDLLVQVLDEKGL